ncbi:MAG: hypothetical protein HOM32_07285, partial [Planctomycetaceae bacterium]|nr:hypothetical protein [Planctomycetaceae bacterium]
MRNAFPYFAIAFYIVALAIGLGSTAANVLSQEEVPSQALTVKEAELRLEELGVELTDNDLERICTAEGLTELDLSGCHRLSDMGLSHVAKLTQLKSLDLTRCHRITEQGIASISRLEHLTSLNISSTRVQLPKVYALLQHLPELTKLEVKDIRGFTSVGLQKLTRLTYLDISNTGGNLTDAELVPLAPLTLLKYLNLNGSRVWGANRNVTDAGLKHLEGMTSLEFLGLFGYFSLTAKGYNPLFMKLSKLKRLEMGFNWP